MIVLISIALTRLNEALNLNRESSEKEPYPKNVNTAVVTVNLATFISTEYKQKRHVTDSDESITLHRSEYCALTLRKIVEDESQ
ncbi:hypothetical protein JV59_24845 (plasmid) [Vibrio coralliilyticus]|nr:hypothetical protein JV59_24845 [Vibrio coralliilyticus]